MKLTLPYPPSANRYWRVFRGMVVPSAEAKAYKNTVALLGQVAKLKPFDGPVAVVVRVFRPIRRGDLDNRLKVLLDALREVAFDDDDQVERIEATRHEDKENPRVEVEVLPLATAFTERHRCVDPLCCEPGGRG